MQLGKFVYCNLPVIEIPESLNASQMLEHHVTRNNYTVPNLLILL